MLDVKQWFKSPRGTATAGEICRSGSYYAAPASQYLGGEKNNECAFFHNVGEMGCCSSMFMSALAYQSECICFVLLTADIKAVFWLQHLK